MLNRWRSPAYSITHFSVFLPLSIILGGEVPFIIERQAYPLRDDDVVEYEVLSNFILEESKAIGISVVHLHNSRFTTDMGERPRSRVESRPSYRVLSCIPFFFPSCLPEHVWLPKVVITDGARARVRERGDGRRYRDSFCKFAVDWKTRAA